MSSAPQPQTASRPLLELRGLSVHYGAIAAVRSLSLQVMPGQTVALIGANGAGKTSTLKAIAGLLPSDGGLFFQGLSLHGLAAEQRPQRGLVLVPEGRGLFSRMTVLENLMLGLGVRASRSRLSRADRQGALEEAYDRFPRLRDRRHQLAGLLSGGEQQMLAIARGLLAQPSMLLLDEPSMGLAPILVDEIFAVIQAVKAQGVSLLLVEQNAGRALALADQAYVLASGQLELQGSGPALLQDPAVQAAYLGGQF